MRLDHIEIPNPDLSSIENVRETPFFLRTKIKFAQLKEPFNYRRICRRAGVKRMSASINKEAHKALKNFLGIMVRRAVIISQHQKRKTITAQDVRYALK